MNTPSRSPQDPSLTPLPLSASQESQVLALYHKRVRQQCAAEVRAFATCCTNRTFTAPLFCRAQQSAMNECMLRFATAEMRDAARREWFESSGERVEEKRQKEERRKRDEVFWREWWDKEKGLQDLERAKAQAEGKR